MVGAKIAVGPPTSGEWLGLYAVCEEYGVPYSSLRAWVKAGIVPSYVAPNRRVFLKRTDIEAKLFRPVEPNNTNNQED